ncbi:transcriptional regulator [Planotetraspora thailandica]|uniref:Transcriptional regulator n=1 Tax=Planotetraspora thailandica TaxID=487172 RepID=A0A8J3V3F5_9ACTN|nr:IclR family transcriptional regulator C-terminal domain-containing protein [Planotetraspora thailandica]GII54286.1 transcriptional regulator [Planotetraspora thailandica]
MTDHLTDHMTVPTTSLAPPDEAVGPLIRGLSVLRHLAAAGGRRSVSDLVRDVGLARSTVDRVLSTLAALGYARLDGQEAVLTPRVMELGNAYLAASRLPDVLGPPADRLADELDESVSLAVPDHDGVRFVHQAPRRRTMSVTFRAGDLIPAERAAPGALFAADWSHDDWLRWRDRRASDPGGPSFPIPLPRNDKAVASFEERAAEARRDGWALDDQMIEPGLVAVAMPVHDGARRPACAVSVVSHTTRHSARSLRESVVARLRSAVADMERTLASAEPAHRRPAAEAVRMRALKHELGPDFVESLARGLHVLTAFGPAGGGSAGGSALTALAQASGLARATVRRSLITLEHLGYVEALEGRLFRLTPRVLDFGFAALSRLTLPQIARRHLVWLTTQVHDSASMAVLAGDDIQYVARVAASRIMSMDITVGTRFPAYATSMGRVLLSGLPPAGRAAVVRRSRLSPLTSRTVTSPERLAALLDQAAQDGHVLVDQELEDGLRAIAVPVRDLAGNVVAAINVSMHADRRTEEEARAQVLPPLRTAAARIEADLHVAGRYLPISAG